VQESDLAAEKITESPADGARPARPAWAARIDGDRFGCFAELALAEGVNTRLRWIPPGHFLMGSTESEFDRWEDEGPRHRVVLSEGFWLADAPSTQAEWQAVMDTTPSLFQGANRPVERVPWLACQQFCERLRERDARLLARLPSEAEWEYACRAGTDGPFNDGSDPADQESQEAVLLRLGWFEKNGAGETHPVRELLPNRWGLFDMHGNVMEWCQDQEGRYEAGERMDPMGSSEPPLYVCRGGGWHHPAKVCRSASRFALPPVMGYYALGFRLAVGT
jgi:formylglycine-generating enzyme required for sulfatase activity